MANVPKPRKPPLTPEERKQRAEEEKQRSREFRRQFMSSMSTSMMMVVAMLVLIPRVLSTTGVALAQARATTYVGRTDHRELQAIPMLRWIDLIADPPHTAWTHCFIINDGPGAVEIAINHPNDRFVMGPGETRTIDRTGAEEQILAIFYNAVPGHTASLRITGEY